MKNCDPRHPPLHYNGGRDCSRARHPGEYVCRLDHNDEDYDGPEQVGSDLPETLDVDEKP